MEQIVHPLAAHLQNIKRRLLIVGATMLGLLVLTFSFSADMVAWLNRPFENQLAFYGPTEALFASIKVSLLAAFILSLPVIFYHCWKLIEPALLPKEQRWAIPLFMLAGALFGLGMVFCNAVILPLVIDWFVSFGLDRDITPQLGVGIYIDFNVKFLLIFGCAFELPLAMTLAAVIGAASAQTFARYRKHAILLCLIVSAVVTPDATLFTMLLMAVPLMLLYEVGIIGARVFGRSQDHDGMDLPTDPDVPFKTAGTRMR
ncbi:MAG: twin-arginine translocase subunit TatC [Nitrospira sp.]|nr:twin-arginine translocase subunit TatC [Nitrospira sp.]MDH4242409.1 twin-arginine translocase subunit TatC [Nitrospira sp.]MDH4357451.1 twin-arginine translocase subunit TatC [Nitrospira sp.]MDH5316918.1 twin-arginine translocase subunit TatC [Nitrospira sp.]